MTDNERDEFYDSLEIKINILQEQKRIKAIKEHNAKMMRERFERSDV